MQEAYMDASPSIIIIIIIIIVIDIIVILREESSSGTVMTGQGRRAQADKEYVQIGY